jgi:nicotinate phosphoribosyltransferase
MPERRRQPWPFGSAGALFTDLYELTMAQAYDAEAMEQLAVFELYFRKMPPQRGYLIAAGLAEVLDYLEDWQFTDDDLEYLRSQELFSEVFLDRLRRVRFSGAVYAVAEGTPIFPYEPLVQVVAPILEAQLIETFLLNQVHFQTIVASKAARVIEAAAGRAVVDFGSRRAHGTDAALKVARTSYLAGAAGTSNVLAGKVYGLPIFGTMAHSYLQAHEDERQAFEAFATLFPETTLLVDTYDTQGGVRKVIELARKLGDRFRVRAVRLDSGDLAELSRQTRQLLDDAGLPEVRIFASSGLDEYKIAKLIEAGAVIDGFGVGTNLVVSEDAPHLDMAYKLVEYAGEARTKLSTDKVIYPWRKQIFRREEGGRLAGDLLARHDEEHEGEPLLELVMGNGKRLPAGEVSLEEARQHARKQLGRLPDSLRALGHVETPYPVEVSPLLQKDLEALQQRLHHTPD